MIQYVLVCKKGKLRPQVGVVLWCWHEGRGTWLKDLLLTNHRLWSRSSGVTGPGVKRRRLSNELQTPSIVAVVFEALQLWQRHLELAFDKILDFGAGYYGCYTTDATTLAVDVKNLMIYLFLLHKSLEHWYTLQLALTPNTLSLCLPAALWSYSQRCLSTPTGESSPSA